MQQHCPNDILLGADSFKLYFNVRQPQIANQKHFLQHFKQVTQQICSNTCSSSLYFKFLQIKMHSRPPFIFYQYSQKMVLNKMLIKQTQFYFIINQKNMAAFVTTIKTSNKNTPDWITHALNKSKTKLAYSFQKSSRFIPEKSFSPNKFYDLPSSFCNRSLSPQRTLRTSFQKDTTLGACAHNLSTSLDVKRSGLQRSNTTFGIGRQQYYKGRSDKSKLGPGSYNVSSSMQKKFYIGRKVQPIQDKNKPDCTAYNVTTQSYNKLSTSKNNGAFKMKVEYYPKELLQPYDNKIPGPGSYKQKGIADSSKNKSYKQNFNRRKTNSSFGIGQRMKLLSSQSPAPDYYNRFSQFGKPKY